MFIPTKATKNSLFTLSLFSPFTINFDAPESWQMLFQDPATPIMEKIIDLHHDILFFLIIVVVFVLWILVRIIALFDEDNTKTVRYAFEHHTLIEQIWTFIPAIILIVVAAPSFALLYTIDEIHEPRITLKVIGKQWYWTYEYSDYVRFFDTKESIVFDSYMVLDEDLTKGSYRLLEVDNRVVLPEQTPIRLLVTSNDVLHSWAVPSLGVKIDACPGRLNQVYLFIKRRGVYYGQCSELCGINHGFMPIVVEVVTKKDYINWVWNKY